MPDAPNVVPERFRRGFSIVTPWNGDIPTMSWEAWRNFHEKLGQELAKRMRERPDD